MTVDPVYTKIPNRGLISISGHDCFTFLQGLVTQDIYLLEQQKSLYSCLLTPNGKFLYDFFIVKDNKTLLIECEGGQRSQELLKRLQMFKLRANVEFKIEEDITIYSVLSAEKEDDTYPDPRHIEMGYRCFEKPDNAEESSFDIWDKKRIKLGVPDGRRDLIPEKSTLLESNIDKLNGVDFQKGCYMGQELTARMHYRGLTKKTLIPVEFDQEPPAPFTDLHDKNGKSIGEMRSSCDNIGLALLKKSALEQPEHLPFKLLSY